MIFSHNLTEREKEALRTTHAVATRDMYGLEENIRRSGVGSEYTRILEDLVIFENALFEAGIIERFNRPAFTTYERIYVGDPNENEYRLFSQSR